jgi:hypothetical protein
MRCTFANLYVTLVKSSGLVVHLNGKDRKIVTNLLLERLVGAVPREFVTWLLARQQTIYRQSIAFAFNNENWTPAEAMSVLPYIRRGLFESEFRKAGIECGLKTFDMPHAGENCSCVMVKASGLILTEHYVDGPGQWVRDALSRKQNTAVNRWLEEFADERLLLHPLPKLGRKPIYLNVLHGGHFANSETDSLTIDPSSCFLRFAIPEFAIADEGSKKYLHNWSAQEVLLAYESTANTALAPQTIEDKAQPKKKAQVLVMKKVASGNAE